MYKFKYVRKMIKPWENIEGRMETIRENHTFRVYNVRDIKTKRSIRTYERQREKKITSKRNEGRNTNEHLLKDAADGKDTREY